MLFGYIPGMTIFSGVLTFLVIAFSEVVPKTLGERHAEKTIVVDISCGSRQLINYINRSFGSLKSLLAIYTFGSALAVTSEAEIKLLELGHRAGIIEAEESELTFTMCLRW